MMMGPQSVPVSRSGTSACVTRASSEETNKEGPLARVVVVSIPSSRRFDVRLWWCVEFPRKKREKNAVEKNGDGVAHAGAREADELGHEQEGPIVRARVATVAGVHEVVHDGREGGGAEELNRQVGQHLGADEQRHLVRALARLAVGERELGEREQNHGEERGEERGGADHEEEAVDVLHAAFVYLRSARAAVEQTDERREDAEHRQPRDREPAFL